MELHFQYEVLGEKQVGFTFKELEVKVTDLREPFAEIAQDYYEGEEKTFDEEGAFEGKPSWTPLSEDYAKRKKMIWGDMPILVASGALKRAAVSNTADGSVFRLGKTDLAMGVNLPVGGWNLALLHQLGTRKMPSREVIRITPPQEKRWIRSFRDFLWRKTKEAEK